MTEREKQLNRVRTRRFYERNRARVLAEQKSRRDANLDYYHTIERAAYKRKRQDPSWVEREAAARKRRAAATRERANEKNRLNRLTVLKHYGMRCECCSQSAPQFLAVDHVNGGGKRHKKEIGTDIYRWLIKNKFPEGFRILCHNCNCALGFYGYCHPQLVLSELG